jgi:RNA polymerase sigma factor (sigma-70 family)
MSGDAELLERWREGDKTAGNELFLRHFEPIRRFFLNKAGNAVEDLVQRTFLRLVEGKERFEGRSSFRTFTFGIAYNVLREHYRGHRRAAAGDLDDVSVHDLGAGPLTIAAARQEQRLLLEALRRIPLQHQIVLELYFWEQFSGPELADFLGVPENTARSRIRRAKEVLSEVIGSLAASAGEIESASRNLDGWAESIRAQLENAAPLEAED